MDIFTIGGISIVALLSGGVALSVKALFSALVTDVAKRIGATLWGIKFFHRLTPRFLRHPKWSGQWKVTWEVESTNFDAINTDTVELYRVFNRVALEAPGKTSAGDTIIYGFVGTFSRDKTIITGTWFDKRVSDAGYHGAYQVRLAGNGRDVKGVWIGFSETSEGVKSGPLRWVSAAPAMTA